MSAEISSSSLSKEHAGGSEGDGRGFIYQLPLPGGHSGCDVDGIVSSSSNRGAA